MKERKQSSFKKIGSSLPKIVDKNIKEKNFVEISLIKKWSEIVGIDISKFCWPVKITYANIKNINGTIFLKTKRGKSLEIEFKNDEIIEKLNRYFGYKAVDKISIMQDFQDSEIHVKKINKKKEKKIDSKLIDKIKKNELKLALKKLNKTLFE